MTSIESQPKTPERPLHTDKEVAIVGAGIAGLTCALRLSERGYKVTLYEKEPMLGGDLSSEYTCGMFHDVYPHLFCDWYVNFWRIVENDLKIRRDDVFEPRMSVKLLDDPSRQSPPARHRPDRVNAAATSTAKPPARGPAAKIPTGVHAELADKSRDDAPRYHDLRNANSLKRIWENLCSGALPPAEMFLVGFTLLDLASQPFRGTKVLQQQTVNGFLYSRPYATEDCADLHNMILMEIWSIPSNDTSAASYKDFVSCALGCHAEPFAWLLRGSLQEMLIAPWQHKLEAAGCHLKTSVGVTTIELGDDRDVHLTLSDGTEARHANVVLAVPAPELARLAMSGAAGRRVVDRVPELAELRRLSTARILVVTVVFNEKLPDIPREHVGLAGSLGFLTFVDISQLWTSLRNELNTVLILAASDADAFTSEGGEIWAYKMIEELARYLPVVRPGKGWGASDSNINYAKSRPLNQKSRTLFLNQVSSEQWQPQPCYPTLQNVFLAGDFCRNEVKMATVEAATLSGLHAACAVQTRTEGHSDITIAPQAVFRADELSVMKLALLPAAYSAKAWSTLDAALRDLASGHIVEGIVAPLTTISLIPLKYTADWIGTLEAVAVGLLSAAEEPHAPRSMVPVALRAAVRGLVSGGGPMRDFASERFHRHGDKPRSLAARLAEIFETTDAGSGERSTPRPERGGLFDSLQSALAEGGGMLRGSGRYQSRSEYLRRHRAKL